MLRPRVSGPGLPAGSVRVRVTRDLGLFDVTMAAVGAMVGAAIFLLVGAAYTVSGPLVLASLGVAAFIAALAGMAYAELASGRPDASGGAYIWVRSALPSPSGFLSGWLSWGGHMAAPGLSAPGLIPRTHAGDRRALYRVPGFRGRRPAVGPGEASGEQHPAGRVRRARARLPGLRRILHRDPRERADGRAHELAELHRVRRRVR